MQPVPVMLAIMGWPVTDGPCFMAVRDNIDRTADHDGRASLGTDLPGKIRMPAQIAFRTQGVKVRVHPLGCADPFRQIRDFRNIALNDVKTDFPEQHRCCFIAKTGSPPRPRDRIPRGGPACWPPSLPPAWIVPSCSLSVPMFSTSAEQCPTICSTSRKSSAMMGEPPKASVMLAQSLTVT